MTDDLTRLARMSSPRASAPARRPPATSPSPTSPAPGHGHGLHAWLTLDRRACLAEADEADARLSAPAPMARRRRRPPFAARIPVALKGLVSVAGGRPRRLPHPGGVPSPFDLTSPSAPRRRGVILAKTTSRFAMGASRTFGLRAESTLGISTACRAVPPVGPRRPWRPARCRWDRPTPAAPSASRPRCADRGHEADYGR